MTELEFLRKLEQVVQHVHHALSVPNACPSDATRVRVALTYTERAKKLLNDRIVEAAAPDRYCVTTADGDCISADPRCMHQPR